MSKEAVLHKCGICGKDRLTLLYGLGDKSVVRCGCCGAAATVFKDERPPSQERFNQERWLDTRDLQQGLQNEVALGRYEYLEQFMPGTDLLEVGCGTGEFLEVARQKGHRVTGVETSPLVLNYLRSFRPHLEIKECELDDAGFTPGSFDVVAAFHLLEHIEAPGEFLVSLRELLRPGGLVYVRVPNLDSWYRKVLGQGWGGFCDEHFWHFTQDSLAGLLESASFTVLDTGSFENPKYSLWPVLPLLFNNDMLHRKLGGVVAPSKGRRGKSGENFYTQEKMRRNIKKALLAVYMCYRRAGSALLSPFIEMQTRNGGGSELYAVGWKKA